MERVKNILQKLQEVYYNKHQKSAIDIDLMLDYTRVMYADLLEWRHRFKEEPLTTESAEPNNNVVTSEKEPQPVPAVAPVETVVAEPEAEAPLPVSKDAVAEKEATAGADNAYQPIQHDDPLPKEPETGQKPVTEVEPEKEYIDALQKDVSGISFEPPSAPETRSEPREELLIEEPAVQQAVAEIPVLPAAAIPLPDMTAKVPSSTPPANLFSAVKVPKDIRSAIGINDKYLFLNELFNNHKSNYEEALDKLNRFSTAEQAEDWIRTKIAPAHKWEQEDATVASFYALVKRHFSER